MLRSAAAAAVLCVLAACGGGPDSVLDDGPRFPDAEGVVTEITLERIQLAGGKTYEIGDEVESFTTRSHEVTALLSWKDKYVQIGTDEDDIVEWIAGIGTVVKGSGDPYTLYTGVFDEVDDESGRAIFQDGTTLAVADGVELPDPGESVVTIDPDAREIVKVASA